LSGRLEIKDNNVWGRSREKVTNHWFITCGLTARPPKR